MKSGRPALITAAKQLLTGPLVGSLQAEELAPKAVALARVLLQLSELSATDKDLEQRSVLSSMMTDPRGQVFTTLLADRAYRSKSPKRTVEQARHLLERVGAPRFLNALDRLSLSALQRVGTWLPSLSGTAMLSHIRQETSGFILPAEEAELGSYLRARKAKGARVNVNHLGEEVLGEAEAKRRVEGYVNLLQQPSVEVISVKVSSIYSQPQPLAFETNVAKVAERLAPIYRAALDNRTAQGAPKLVTLDMESYRDIDLTLSAFMRALSEPSLNQLAAGVVLQAYLPDSDPNQRLLLEWAKQRVQRGGAPIRMRLVKGANLAMERVESSIRGWPLPIYASKAEVDANYKRMLLRGCEPENASAVNLGVASHNLFDLSLGLVASAAAGSQANVSFELLEGMANPLLESLLEIGASVLVYAPIVLKDEFPSAIAYLTRRLDENTAKENYLAHSFSMHLDSDAWKQQQRAFESACAQSGSVSSSARRDQDRGRPAIGLELDAPFRNEPDTDFGLAANRRHFDEWLQRLQAGHFKVASSTRQGQSVELQNGFDPSRPGHVPYEIELATRADVDKALGVAHTLTHSSPVAASERELWLSQAALALRQNRAELVALMVLDAGKRVEEADVEVSEAIDFAEYYLRCHRELREDPHLQIAARGTVVVTPPWNFPLAIGLGGVFAALVAGNPVILKPPLETPLVASRACQLLWNCGIGQDWLQLVVCEDEIGSALITDPRTDTVVLTGATATAQLFQRLRPGLRLLAETGGKNALFVSAMSDREQAIGDIIASAFGHAGQKCSALSQLILEREVYHDRGFREALLDAASSLKVGSAWDKDTFVTPLINPPSTLQQRALTELDPGEHWLLEPHFDSNNPRLVSPGIKFGVVPGSPAHRTEYFCPLISVLECKDVRHATEIANATPYGLTAGIHSLDEREQEYFIEHIQAGNVYVNRRITGAIVRRQPFGGWKSSSFGPGAKAGGPNYVSQFTRHHACSPQATTDERELPSALEQLLDQMAGFVPLSEARVAARHFVRLHTEWFASPQDPSQLRGEDNLACYRSIGRLLVVVDKAMTPLDLASIALAARVTDCALELVVCTDGEASGLAEKLGGPEFVCAASAQFEERLTQTLGSTHALRLRCTTPIAERAANVARDRHIHVIEGKPELTRFELLHSLREQAVSVSYHRHGHTGLRGL
ncbi:MAG TPA: proline dehydrogenase family protein [Polyangiaceae bacterium]|jgi:RHH-type proline utilization regulon transcriptional repressor/proline dehydrogenase/delta 1-pyrroline-5-carboxylate dehydrogenase|nr:proline dehydrogenase family protein [Polyangiaceae bacterium]